MDQHESERRLGSAAAAAAAVADAANLRWSGPSLSRLYAGTTTTSRRNVKHITYRGPVEQQPGGVPQSPSPRFAVVDSSDNASVSDSSVRRLIAPTSRHKLLMRQVSGLGMEDPVYGSNSGPSNTNRIVSVDGSNSTSMNLSNSSNHTINTLVYKKKVLLHPGNLFDDMCLHDMPDDVLDLVSVASDPSANLWSSSGVGGGCGESNDGDGGGGGGRGRASHKNNLLDASIFQASLGDLHVGSVLMLKKKNGKKNKEPKNNKPKIRGTDVPLSPAPAIGGGSSNRSLEQAKKDKIIKAAAAGVGKTNNNNSNKQRQSSPKKVSSKNNRLHLNLTTLEGETSNNLQEDSPKAPPTAGKNQNNNIMQLSSKVERSDGGNNNNNDHDHHQPEKIDIGQKHMRRRSCGADEPLPSPRRHTRPPKNLLVAASHVAVQSPENKAEKKGNNAKISGGINNNHHNDSSCSGLLRHHIEKQMNHHNKTKLGACGGGGGAGALGGQLSQMGVESLTEASDIITTEHSNMRSVENDTSHNNNNNNNGEGAARDSSAVVASATKPPTTTTRGMGLAGSNGGRNRAGDDVNESDNKLSASAPLHRTLISLPASLQYDSSHQKSVLGEADSQLISLVSEESLTLEEAIYGKNNKKEQQQQQRSNKGLYQPPLSIESGGQHQNQHQHQHQQQHNQELQQDHTEQHPRDGSSEQEQRDKPRRRRTNSPVRKFAHTKLGGGGGGGGSRYRSLSPDHEDGTMVGGIAAFASEEALVSPGSPCSPTTAAGRRSGNKNGKTPRSPVRRRISRDNVLNHHHPRSPTSPRSPARNNSNNNNNALPFPDPLSPRSPSRVASSSLYAGGNNNPTRNNYVSKLRAPLTPCSPVHRGTTTTAIAPTSPCSPLRRISAELRNPLSPRSPSGCGGTANNESLPRLSSPRYGSVERSKSTNGGGGAASRDVRTSSSKEDLIHAALSQLRNSPLRISDEIPAFTALTAGQPKSPTRNVRSTNSKEDLLSAALGQLMLSDSALHDSFEGLNPPLSVTARCPSESEERQDEREERRTEQQQPKKAHHHPKIPSSSGLSSRRQQQQQQQQQQEFCFSQPIEAEEQQPNHQQAKQPSSSSQRNLPRIGALFPPETSDAPPAAAVRGGVVPQNMRCGRSSRRFEQLKTMHRSRSKDKEKQQPAASNGGGNGNGNDNNVPTGPVVTRRSSPRKASSSTSRRGGTKVKTPLSPSQQNTTTSTAAATADPLQESRTSTTSLGVPPPMPALSLGNYDAMSANHPSALVSASGSFNNASGSFNASGTFRGSAAAAAPPSPRRVDRVRSSQLLEDAIPPPSSYNTVKSAATDLLPPAAQENNNNTIVVEDLLRGTNLSSPHGSFQNSFHSSFHNSGLGPRLEL